VAHLTEETPLTSVCSMATEPTQQPRRGDGLGSLGSTSQKGGKVLAIAPLCTYPATVLWYEDAGVHIEQPAHVLRCLKLATSYTLGMGSSKLVGKLVKSKSDHTTFVHWQHTYTYNIDVFRISSV
jgi:hypothetical protein